MLRLFVTSGGSVEMSSRRSETATRLSATMCCAAVLLPVGAYAVGTHRLPVHALLVEVSAALVFLLSWSALRALSSRSAPTSRGLGPHAESSEARPMLFLIKGSAPEEVASTPSSRLAASRRPNPTSAQTKPDRHPGAPLDEDLVIEG